ncbi:MAG: hypothetical protein JRI34_00925 [Deltaproteobacteria bacterium]|nr:hypothetical protein [Deltaproteobacteria bacterium]
MRVQKKHLVFSAEGELLSGGKRLKIIANSGRPFKHFWWQKLALDFAGMTVAKSRNPVLMAHDTSKILGYFDQGDVQVQPGGPLIIEAELVNSEAANEFVNLVEQGVPFEASVYAEPENIEEIQEDSEAEVNGYTFVGPGHIFRKWTLKEVSPAIFGMDSATSADLFSFKGSSDLVEIPGVELSADERIAERLFQIGKSGAWVDEDPDPEAELWAGKLFEAGRRS